MTDKPVLRWSCSETLGLGIPNPGTRASITVTPEMLESLRPQAEAAGLTPGEYLEREIDRWNAEEDARDAEA